MKDPRNYTTPTGNNSLLGHIDWNNVWKSLDHYLNGFFLAIKSFLGDSGPFEAWKRVNKHMDEGRELAKASAAQPPEKASVSVSQNTAPLQNAEQHSMDVASGNAREAFGRAASPEPEVFEAVTLPEVAPEIPLPTPSIKP